MAGRRPRRVGFDLDNTIIDYRALFLGLGRREGWLPADCRPEKSAVKQGLRALADDAALAEKRWRQLQAWAYGDALHQAYVFDGFAACVQLLRKFHVELFIVSHKTEVSNFDTDVHLRVAARRFLHGRGFFGHAAIGGLGFSEQAVFFEDTRQAKAARIAALDLDVFVDDLPEMFATAGFPATTQALWFSPPAPDGADTPVDGLPRFSTWSELTWWFDLHCDITPALPPTRSWRPLRDGGNNCLFQVGCADGSRWALKTFGRDDPAAGVRVQREAAFVRALQDQGIDTVAAPRGDGDHWLLSQWLDGTPLTAEDDAAWQQLFAFLRRLDAAGRDLAEDALPAAAHARFSLNAFVAQIQQRFDAIQGACANEPLLKEVESFVSANLATDLLQMKEDFKVFCREHQLDPDAVLAPALRFPSPSDFGFHNALEVDGRLMFVDFEYAGWDDPAKLLADLVHHLGFTTPYPRRLALVQEFIPSRRHDPDLGLRFRAVHDLVALEWILIVLNVAVPEERRRKLRAGVCGGDEIALISQRLQRAKLLQSNIQRLRKTSISV